MHRGKGNNSANVPLAPASMLMGEVSRVSAILPPISNFREAMSDF